MVHSDSKLPAVCISVSLLIKKRMLTSVKAASVHTEQFNRPLSTDALGLLACVRVLYNVSCSAYKLVLVVQKALF